MISWKIAAAAGLIGAATSLFFAYMWKSEQVEIAKLEAQVTGLRGELDQSRANNETLKTQIKQQVGSVNRMLGLVEKNEERVNEVERQRDAARVEMAKALAEVNSMRATEMGRALADPYDRGNAAFGRITDSLRRISGETGGAHSGGDDPDAAEVRDVK